MKKKTIVIISVASVIAIAGGVTAAVLLTKKPAAPEVKQGELYQTKPESFWASVGAAYMSFSYNPEPSNKPETDTTKYGYRFNINVSTDSGKTYASWLDGEWNLNDVKSDLTLKAEWEEGENQTTLADTTSGQVKSYTAVEGVFTIGVVIPSAGTINFKLNPVQDAVGDDENNSESTSQDSSSLTSEPTSSSSIEASTSNSDSSQEAEIQMSLSAKSASGQSAKLDLYNNNTWSVSIKYWDGGDYTPTVDGTWAFDQAYNIVLTVTNDTGNVLSEDTYTLACDYITYTYSGTMVFSIPSLGDITFNFAAESDATHFNVSFDLNYQDAPNNIESVETTSFAGESGNVEYVKNVPTAPEREGYKFAGWYLVSAPVFENGASESEYLFGSKITTYNAAPDFLKNEVMPITQDTTLYARWVEKVSVTTEAQLRQMKNDLTGWYSIDADITLTSEWEPLGSYYGYYEFYEPSWWLYSFRGTIEGNNHKIDNMSLTSLDFGSDEIETTHGSKDGTSAFIGSAVNCYVDNLNIENATIDLTYQNSPHAYVSFLAAFVQGGTTVFKNCNVKNSTVTCDLTNIAYTAVAGLFGGQWGGNAYQCNVENTTIDVKTSFSGETTTVSDNNYVGGLVGEGYAWLKNCSTDASINYELNDTRSANSTNIVNTYVGGASASSTYLQGVTALADITVDFTKEAGKSEVDLGGLSGLQRYGYIDNCYSNNTIQFNNHNTSTIENQVFNYGSILGGYDASMAYYGVYFGIAGNRISHCLNKASFTKTGTEVFSSTENTIGSMPLDAVASAYLQALGANVGDYTNSDGSLNYFGTFSSVTVNGSESEKDINGNITVTDLNSTFGNNVKTILGEGWDYHDGALPTPKTVA